MYRQAERVERLGGVRFRELQPAGRLAARVVAGALAVREAAAVGAVEGEVQVAAVRRRLLRVGRLRVPGA